MADNRQVSNFVDGFLELTDQMPSPKIYRKWSGIAAVSAAMTKRVWTPSDNNDILPNTCIILVGSPGVGKGPAIDAAELLLSTIDYSKNPARSKAGIRIGPNDTTPPGMFDELLDPGCQKAFIWDGNEFNFQNLVLIAEELGAFLHTLDMRMMSYLIRLLNCKSTSQRLRKQEQLIEVESPVISILGGVQPDTLQEIFPPAAWGMGLTARTVFVFSNEAHPRPVFTFGANGADTAKHNLRQVLARKPLFKALATDLATITRLTGPFLYTEEAGRRVNSWWLDGEAKRSMPHHPRLRHYAVKRIQHLVRLVMVLNISRTNSLVVELHDVESAIRELYAVEKVMPHLFSAMTTTTSQSNVIGDVAHQFLSMYRTTSNPIPHHVALSVIGTKVPIYSVNQTLQQLVDQQLLQEVQLDRRLPGAGGRRGYIPTSLISELDEHYITHH